MKPNDDAPGRGCGWLADPAFLLRSVRRRADLSQRELAARLGLDRSQVARVEAGRRRLTIEELERVLAIAGMRLAVVDSEDRPVELDGDPEVRDRGGRRFPAHLDVRYFPDIPWFALQRVQHDIPLRRAWYEHRAGRDLHRDSARRRGRSATP
ncbi:helix-turn-helix domain-containing protein [Agromyces protaetiae]|nr:helix-turn-helix transcriptional regulator [Agromyces protaetiae]